MKFKLLSIAGMLLCALALVTFLPSRAHAQEGEMQVVDEVIAQVNDDVITLSTLKRETKERIDVLKQQGMTQQQAADEVGKHQIDLIVTMINEQLLLQKGKELDLASDVEAEVNRRLLQIANEQGITTIANLEIAMKQSGLVLADVRQTMRSEMMKQAVLQQQVDRPVYLSFTTDAVKKYFDAHKDKFRTPESVTISEIFLTTTDKDDAAVKARATELVAQIRAGADFKALAASNSEREKNGARTAPKDGGEVGTFEVPSLREDIAAALKGVKEGGVTDVIRSPDGYQILRVDKRTAEGTSPSFNENQVREAMLMEHQGKERDDYMQKLRNEAFIKIAETYRAQVEPLLKITTTTAAKSDDKESNKKSKKP